MHVIHFIQTPDPQTPVPQTPVPQTPVPTHEYKRNQSLLGKNPILSRSK
jgi:hypothetical protein